jgi:hypothetical protein
MDDLIQTRNIFIKHNHQLTEMRKKHTKNRLFKYCLSSLWGCQGQANKKTRTEEAQLKNYSFSPNHLYTDIIILFAYELKAKFDICVTLTVEEYHCIYF